MTRPIILDSQLTEALKWGVPCYSFNGKNVVLIHGFKEYCAILFVKGTLLKDPDYLLVQQTKNVQAGCQRAYFLYFSRAKQASTCEARVAKYIPEILEGKGLDD